jgi:hypothetical protein
MPNNNPDQGWALPITTKTNGYRKRSMFGPGLLVSTFFIIAGIGGYFLHGTATELHSNIRPLIRAPEGPIKSRPKFRGGMKVPYMGVEVLNSPNTDAPVFLKPLPEEPILFPETPTAEDVAGIKRPTPSLIPDAVEKPAHDVIKKSETIYRVQIASVKSVLEANQEWKRLNSKYPILLRRLKLTVTRVDLNEKGVFFRLLIGPLPDKSAAKEFCRLAKNRKIACLIHRIVE